MGTIYSKRVKVSYTVTIPYPDFIWVNGKARFTCLCPRIRHAKKKKKSLSDLFMMASLEWPEQTFFFHFRKLYR